MCCTSHQQPWCFRHAHVMGDGSKRTRLAFPRKFRHVLKTVSSIYNGNSRLHKRKNARNLVHHLRIIVTVRLYDGRCASEDGCCKQEKSQGFNCYNCGPIRSWSGSCLFYNARDSNNANCMSRVNGLKRAHYNIAKRTQRASHLDVCATIETTAAADFHRQSERTDLIRHETTISSHYPCPPGEPSTRKKHTSRLLIVPSSMMQIRGRDSHDFLIDKRRQTPSNRPCFWEKPSRYADATPPHVFYIYKPNKRKEKNYK